MAIDESAILSGFVAYLSLEAAVAHPRLAHLMDTPSTRVDRARVPEGGARPQVD